MSTDEAVELDAPDHRRAGLALRVLLAVLILLVGAGAGLAAGLAIASPDHPADDSPEAGFLRDMAAHHAQAVDMGTIAYAKATNAEVRSMGLDTALTQHGQVNIMQTWLGEWGLNLNGTQPPMAWMPDGQASMQNGLMPGMATQQQMEELRQAQGKQVDILYLTLMRQHHLGGIHMAQEILEMSDNENVTGIAKNIMESQQYEITAMTDLLAQVQAA
ncbi:hypothetical protein Ait01nite_005750 [Actinoplanes italicus]|uniref:Uncharacterized protein (DUF305 family) n=1 Tax=Actinoplanes italicus TaxID=113567 RepID=A0A2T0KM97_9ACTN|nr:DUF305 domain-containing protein [Actinoplanes italicus]PRX24742.1 uncharacterized protein (DUF305 family) [Actinoplanes italicus]GIE27530.1 hypothetical protein Ait01nite_005750 [Actinoplanes italicus]